MDERVACAVVIETTDEGGEEDLSDGVEARDGVEA